jgi:lysophospholipase L1-like esterase
MKARFKIAFFFLFAVVAAAPGLFSRDQSVFLESFACGGRNYSLDAVFSPGQADVRLRGKTSTNLSAGMRGENILLGIRSGNDNFYVFWLNYHWKAIHLAYYDQRRQRSRLLSLSGFSSFSLPEILETDGELQALVFLGNNSDNVDIFHYELAAEVLTPLTRTPFSEKNLILQETDNGLEIETKSLLAKYRYRFDSENRQSHLLKEERFSRPQKRQTRAGAAITPEYYNTYIGFGDSITAGWIDGVKRLDLCYLSQMRDIYLPIIYGPSGFINLGVAGEDTYESAQRVNQELDQHSAFYFLMMLGVNDVWKASFDLAGSLENLSYIMDAALARHMRVIVSTLTPRKDAFSNYQYYWDNLHALSSGILGLASEKGTASIDTLSAFMNTDPPDGWQDLLENPGTVIVDGEVIQVKGNHPNAAGHSLIASLFADALVKFPPQAPQNMKVIDPLNTRQRTASWDINYESDFSHFRIEFDFQPPALRYSLDTAASYHTFTLFPFLPQLYFRIQAVDRGNHASVFSDQKSSTVDPPKITKEK